MRSGIHNPIIPIAASAGSILGLFRTLDIEGLEISDGIARLLDPVFNTVTADELYDDGARVITELQEGDGIAISGSAPTGITITNTGVLAVDGGTNIAVTEEDGVATVSVTGTVAAATTATHLAGGAAGSLVYQSGAGASTFLALGSSGFILTAGASAPQYTDPASLTVGAAGTATNLAGGNTGYIPYQSGTGVTAFLELGENGDYLTIEDGVLTWDNWSDNLVTSLTGTANQVNVSASTGGVTLSLPQNIHSGASPTFSALTLNSTLTVNSQAIVLNSTSGPFIRFTDGDATSGARNFRVRGNNTQFLMSTENDSNTLVENFMRVTANGSSEVTLTELMGDEIDLTATTLDFNGDADISGTLTLGGVLTRSNATFSANGTTQGAGTNLTADISVITSATEGSAVAVKIPTGVAGREMTVINATAVTLSVYPQNSGQISALGTNAAFTLPPGACVKFIATSSSQWYSLNASYA